jgi:hypothetical protein
MKYFPEIIRILENFRERRTDTVDTDFRAQTENKEFLLYDGVRSGKFPNDIEAADELYETSPTDTRYSSMKNRMKVRMLNSLFHLNLRRAGYSEYAQAYYAAHRGELIVHILFRLGARRAGTHLAERTFRLAQKFALTDVALAMAVWLRNQAGKTALLHEFDHYDKILKQLSRAYQDELLSEEYFDRIGIIFQRYSGTISKYADQFEDYEAELRSHLNENSSYTFRLNYYRVLIVSRNASNRHTDVIKGAQEGIVFLESFPTLLQKQQLAEFWLYQLISYLGIRDFEGAQEAADSCASLYNPGSNNWFAFSESYFYLLMTTLRFQEANKLFDEVTNHPRFGAQGDILREHFEIYKFYLNFALKTLPGYDPKEKPVRFNFDGMLRRADDAKSDKPGMNMVLRFAQIIHLFDIQAYDKIDDLIEPLQIYRTRYIKASNTEQSTIFFRLLKIMVKYSYEYKRCLRMGSKLHEELKTGHFENVDPNQEIQILPYAWLWEWMLERMKERSPLSRR